ncbi:MAG: glycerophosphodiester phosphodiesterase [Candidatus Latescibacteria bacterium]|nr:glycerophosphodiester phosphodiesterase [Candidatus Latescibacterota bacterium]
MSSMTPLILAHRGDSAHAPENTLDAFRLALGAGAAGVEFDIHQARDGTFVVHHDADTPAGPIAELNLADLRGRPAKRGGTIPMLQDALALLAAGGAAFTVFVEVKGMRSWPDLRRQLAPWRGRLDLEVQSFAHDLLAAMARDREGWPLGVIAREPGPDPAALLARFGARTLSLRKEAVTADVAAAVHAAGARLAVWTLNDAGAARAAAAAGADLLIGDDPRLLLSTFNPGKRT